MSLTGIQVKLNWPEIFLREYFCRNSNIWRDWPANKRKTWLASQFDWVKVLLMLIALCDSPMAIGDFTQCHAHHGPPFIELLGIYLFRGDGNVADFCFLRRPPDFKYYRCQAMVMVKYLWLWEISESGLFSNVIWWASVATDKQEAVYHIEASI